MLHFGSRDCLKTAFGPRRRQSLLRMRDRVLRDLFPLSRCGSAQCAAGNLSLIRCLPPFSHSIRLTHKDGTNNF